MLHAVIMAGGSGTRFWPLSRASRPKQLLALVTRRTMIEETVERLEGLVPGERIHVVTNAAYAQKIRELLHEIPASQVVAEPCGRDTAACIGLAASLIERIDPDGVMAVLPADHVVHPGESFREALSRAVRIVEVRRDSLLTFGVVPSRAATGYGYIERGEELDLDGGEPFFQVASFREKPEAALAESFVQSGRFFWNAGIFVFRARAILDRIELQLPELAARLPEVTSACAETGDIPEALYAALPAISIDYGVFEKDRDVVVLPAAFAWDDVGSFAALERVMAADSQGNHALGGVTALDATGNIVVSPVEHRVALIGVSGLVIVHTKDATLVCRKEDAERVKGLVQELGSQGLSYLL
ncbi:MAG: mannose-1-phosphate guanylyltransferase [Planctomycetota bacterium]